MNGTFIFQSIIEGLIGAAIVWIFWEGMLRAVNYFKLRYFEGDYRGYKMNGEEHEQRSYKAKFSFWKNQLILNQTSIDKGNWEANIDINTWNSKIGIGDYIYHTEEHKEKWGTMKIILNKKIKTMTVEAVPQEADEKGIVRYKLVKI